MLHDVGAWPDALVLGIGDPEDNYLPAKLRYRSFPQGIPGNLPLIVYSGVVVVERNSSETVAMSDSPSNILQRAKDLTESAISVSDLASSEKVVPYIPCNVSEPAISTSDVASYLLRRFIQVTEPSISVGDSISMTLRRIVNLSESIGTLSDVSAYTLFRAVLSNETAISVSDAPQIATTRAVNISEDVIIISDIIEYILQKTCETSEIPIMILDLAETEKFVADIVRDITETLGLVIGSMLEKWETMIFQDESEATIIGNQTLSIVIDAQAETEIEGVVE
jgi:hypothetical protein